MKTFTIIYEVENVRFETTVEHWTLDAAREQFLMDHPERRLLEIFEE